MSFVNLYFEINTFCFVILALLLSKIGLGEAMNYGRVLLRRLLVGGMTLCALDVGWIFLDGKTFPGSMELNWGINCLYYIMASLTTYFWFLYSENEQNSRWVATRRRILCCSLPFFTLVILNILSLKTGWIFYVTAANEWKRGSLYFLYTIGSYGYILVTSVKAFWSSLHVQDFVMRQRLQTLTFFAVPSLMIVFISYLFINIPTTCVGITLSALLVFLSQQQQLISLDSLTRLNNRMELQRVLVAKMQHYNAKRQLYLLLLDIDRFKEVNDRYGHVEGDKVLVRLAQVLKDVGASTGCFLARYGGDEFVLVYETLVPGTVGDLCQKVLEGVALANARYAAPYDLNVSIGYAGYQPDITSVEEFIARADAKMYAAKKNAKLHKSGVKA